MTLYLALILLGLLAGLGGGLLGIGGSVIMIPGLVLLDHFHGGTRQHLYQAASMIVGFFIIAPAVRRHTQAGAISPHVVRWTAPTAVLGALVGVFISELRLFRGAGQGYLQLILAAFMLYTVIYNLRHLLPSRKVPAPDPNGGAGVAPTHRSAGNLLSNYSADISPAHCGAGILPARPFSRAALITLVGLPTGLLGGLLGVGGGLIAVPAQQIFFRIPLPNAIANSTATILWSSIVGAIAKNAALGRHGYALNDSLHYALILIPTAMLGSWLAAARVHRWPVAAIRIVFSVLLLYCGARLAQTGVEQLITPSTKAALNANGHRHSGVTRIKAPSVDCGSAFRIVSGKRSATRLS